MTRSIALDIETMSTASNAAVTAIGMVEFHHDEDNEAGDGPRIDREFYISIHLATAVAAGGVMDAATVLWWMAEDLALARRKMLFSAAPCDMALQTAAEWMKNACMGAELNVYARGPQFDCVVLRNAMERSGVRPPWNFRNERDTRTMSKMYPSIESPPDIEGSIKHFALDDARYEARCVWNLWKKLNLPRLHTEPTAEGCPVCGLPQYDSPSGKTCPNGHGF